jgi:hypothetical protein
MTRTGDPGREEPRSGDDEEPLVPSLEGEGIPDHVGALDEKRPTGDAQEGLYPPQDGYVAAQQHGVTAAEQREGESLDDKLARERPDGE